VERWERERILGEWGVRDGTVRSQVERKALEEDLEGSPLKGKRLRRRWRNFRPDAASYVTSLGGPLPYMVRLREIHDLTASLERRLQDAWLELAAECRRDGGAFARRWRVTAESWNFVEVNDLIDRHNRYFPIETRLPMDPKTGDFVLIDGRPYWRRPLDTEWVLERFPPILGRAAA
jgi:hypothetical protein